MIYRKLVPMEQIKRGRPVAKTPLNAPIPVRFTADEQDEIGAAADADGMKRSAFIRLHALRAARNQRRYRLEAP